MTIVKEKLIKKYKYTEEEFNILEDIVHSSIDELLMEMHPIRLPGRLGVLSMLYCEHQVYDKYFKRYFDMGEHALYAHVNLAVAVHTIKPSKEIIDFIADVNDRTSKGEDLGVITVIKTNERKYKLK